MKILSPLALLALSAALLASPLLGCGRSSASDAPAIPASSDPLGKDLVEGAIVTAQEQAGGYRLYKILHVDDLPQPFGTEYHLMAYDPKADTLEASARLWKQGQLKVVLEHFEIPQVNFIKRDHRVIAVEPVTDAEKAPYLKARDSRR
jgi:hypothetical protein